jgi:UDP-glucuronate 4-epimerase
VGKRARINHSATEKGDVPHTHADTTRIQNELGFRPATPVEEGLRAEVEWMREIVPQIR